MDLKKIIAGLETEADPNLLVGIDQSDDAGVYLLKGETALVQTVDFITPVVDDPIQFGRVAAANALSDVYAMGGRPLTALNICCFPSDGIEKATLGQILKGGAEKVREAGAAVIGGHTVQDPELKYGLAVTGLVERRNLITNSGARPGDALVLTKPIGTGVIINAYRRNRVSEPTMQDALHEMMRLNSQASSLMQEHHVHACTDITGFGLLGHALEVAEASRVALQLDPSAIPHYEESLDLISKGVTTASTRCNLALLGGKLTHPPSMSEEWLHLLADPQTSGGLLVSLPPDEAARFVERVRAGQDKRAAIIGKVISGPNPRLEISG